MSVAFAPHRQRGKGDITPAGIQKVIHLFERVAEWRLWYLTMLAVEKINVAVPNQVRQ